MASPLPPLSHPPMWEALLWTWTINVALSCSDHTLLLSPSFTRLPHGLGQSQPCGWPAAFHCFSFHSWLSLVIRHQGGGQLLRVTPAAVQTSRAPKASVIIGPSDFLAVGRGCPMLHRLLSVIGSPKAPSGYKNWTWSDTGPQVHLLKSHPVLWLCCPIEGRGPSIRVFGVLGPSLFKISVTPVLISPTVTLLHRPSLLFHILRVLRSVPPSLPLTCIPASLKLYLTYILNYLVTRLKPRFLDRAPSGVQFFPILQSTLTQPEEEAGLPDNVSIHYHPIWHPFPWTNINSPWLLHSLLSTSMQTTSSSSPDSYSWLSTESTVLFTICSCGCLNHPDVYWCWVMRSIPLCSPSLALGNGMRWNIFHTWAGALCQISLNSSRIPPRQQAWVWLSMCIMCASPVGEEPWDASG